MIWPVLIIALWVVYALESLRKLTMSNQAKLNAIATQVGAISTQVTRGLGEVTAKIDQLKNQAPEGLDFSGLETVVSNLQVAAEALDSIVPDEIESEEPETPEAPVAPEIGVDPTIPAIPVLPDPETPATEPEVPSEPGTTTPETPVETETPAPTDPEVVVDSSARGRRGKPANAADQAK